MKRLASAFLLFGGIIACDSVDVAHAVPPPATAAPAIILSDPTCRATTDCASGEACIDGYCRMQPCGSAKPGSPPLGARGVLAAHRELIAIADDGLHPYESAKDPSAVAPLSPTTGLGSLISAAGGDLTGDGPEAIAIAHADSSAVTVMHGANRFELDFGIMPIAIAAGDLDGDAIAELVGVAADGSAAICKAKTCTHASFGASVIDLAIADLDGDGVNEVIALTGRSFITLDVTGKVRATYPAPATLTRFDAGTLGLVGIEDGGYLGFASDTLHFYAAKNGSLSELGTRTIPAGSSDVLVADLDGDGVEEVSVLEDSSIEVFVANGDPIPASTQKTALAGVSHPTRLAIGDIDGDSPIATLHGAPQPAPGPMVPVALVAYPPYSTEHSDGTSQIVIGSSDSTSNAEASTLSLRASLSLGYEGGFGDLVKATVSAKIEKTLSTTKTVTRSIAVGDKFTVNAQTGLSGPDNAVTIVAAACFYAFTYDITDPKGHLGDGADGHSVTLFVPSGGQTSAWSLRRYIDLAVESQDLPRLHVPFAAGNPASYPKQAQTIAGASIPPEDLLLGGDHAYRTSDVAQVGWTLDMTQSKADTTSDTTAVSVRGQLKVGPIVAETELGAGYGTAYTVQVGHTTTFAGNVPPVRDDPKTSNDEAALFGYGFSPVVYRDHYQTPAGAKGGLFVVTYAVSP
jgi:hypothetical protein